MPTFPDGGTDGTSAEPLIRLRGVTKSYDTGKGPFTTLRGVNLSVRAGVFVAIVGRSGSGKSSLANVITGIDRPTSGEVNVAGTRVDALSQRDLALWRGRNVGVVFQFFQLLPSLTIAENVMLPMEFGGTHAVGDRLPRALELLDRVDGVAHEGGDADRPVSSPGDPHRRRAEPTEQKGVSMAAPFIFINTVAITKGQRRGPPGREPRALPSRGRRRHGSIGRGVSFAGLCT